MYPASFEYVAPATLEEALDTLARFEDDAKVLAGGQSLIPLMKLRLAAPSLLVDIRKVPGLKGITRSNGDFRIGALTTHAETASCASRAASISAASTRMRSAPVR